MVGKVVETKNYAMFKRLTGNRCDIERRAKGLKKSIATYGQIIPIMVNELNEVIDGQARLECCRQLDIPVKYLVTNGLTVDECREANSKSNNWKLIDYIDSYAESGEVSYVYLKHLVTRFSEIGIKPIVTITSGLKEWNHAVKQGKFVCDERRYEDACAALSYCIRFLPFIKNAGGGGRAEYYYVALGFCYLLPEVDSELLYEKVKMNQLGLIPVTNTEQALTSIEKIYNYRLSYRNKVMLVQKYKEYMTKKYSWYTARYGSISKGGRRNEDHSNI